MQGGKYARDIRDDPDVLAVCRNDTIRTALMGAKRSLGEDHAAREWGAGSLVNGEGDREPTRQFQRIPPRPAERRQCIEHPLGLRSYEARKFGECHI